LPPGRRTVCPWATNDDISPSSLNAEFVAEQAEGGAADTDQFLLVPWWAGDPLAVHERCRCGFAQRRADLVPPPRRLLRLGVPQGQT